MNQDDTNAVAVVDQQASPTQQTGFQPTNENIELLKNTLGDSSLTDNELQLFLYQAKRTGLDPLARQIYQMKNKGRVTFMVSIDGQRLVAQRTGEYMGQTGTEWCGTDGQWTDVWLKDENPAAARIGVYRRGFEAPVYGVATWKSYGRDVSIWHEKGDVMLAKCAEALALRKAFPQELSGLYTDDEMPPADAPPRQISMADAMKEALAELKRKGVDSREKALTIIFGIADVAAIEAMTPSKMAEVRKAIRTRRLEDLVSLYVEPQHEVIDGEVVTSDEIDQTPPPAEAEPVVVPEVQTYVVPQFKKPNAPGFIHPNIRKLLKAWTADLGLSVAEAANYMVNVINKPDPKTHDEAIAALEALAYDLTEREKARPLTPEGGEHHEHQN